MARINLLFCMSALLLTASHAQANQGNLENPVAGTIESGIGIVSGWHCTANTVTVFIDGTDLGESGVGSIREDTESICGHSNTGFSLLYNYNSLQPGPHQIEVYTDGALLETRQFNSVQSGGVPYLDGVSKTVEVADFPSIGSRATLTWSQAKQSFVVSGIETGSQQAPETPGTYAVYAENASLSCYNGNRYMDQVLTSFTLQNKTGYVLSKVEFKLIFSAPGLLIPVEDSFYYEPAGGIVGPNASKRLDLIPNAYMDFSKAVYPYCGESGRKLEVEVLGAYDANGEKITLN